MPRPTRSTYTVIELGPDGFPVRSYNAVITPFSAGEGGPGPGEPPSPGDPMHPIWGPPGIVLPPGPGFPPVAGHPLPEPPDGPPTLPPDAKGRWIYTDKGWIFVYGPVDKPKPPATK